jgi:phenylacetate-CoA ligase
MTVRTEARVSVSDDALASLSDRLAALIKDNVGVSVTCEVGAPGTLPRSEGKAQRVVDLRGAGTGST